MALIAHSFSVLKKYSLFSHSLTEWYFGCFQVLAIMNKVVINIHVQVFVVMFSIHLDKYWRVLLLYPGVRTGASKVAQC